jgi:hypothetical protein
MRVRPEALVLEALVLGVAALAALVLGALVLGVAALVALAFGVAALAALAFGVVVAPGALVHGAPVSPGPGRRCLFPAP